VIEKAAAKLLKGQGLKAAKPAESPEKTIAPEKPQE
jgi:hypothetical protein